GVAPSPLLTIGYGPLPLEGLGGRKVAEDIRKAARQESSSFEVSPAKAEGSYSQAILGGLAEKIFERRHKQINDFSPQLSDFSPFAPDDFGPIGGVFGPSGGPYGPSGFGPSGDPFGPTGGPYRLNGAKI
ncbi:hypothetical protein FRX31_023925, partial [Thalictrum thalictroides]